MYNNETSGQVATAKLPAEQKQNNSSKATQNSTFQVQYRTVTK